MKSNIILYALSTGLNKGYIILVFPILSTFLSIEDFGRWSLVIVVSNLLIPIISLNGSASIIREGSGNLKLGFSLFLRYTVLTFIISLIIISIFYFFIGNSWFFYSFVIALSESIFFLLLTYFRIKEESKKYFLLTLIKTSFIIVLALYSKYLLLSVDEILVYHFIVVFLLSIIIFLFIYFMNYTNAFSYNFYPILLFGITLIPHGLSQWIMSSSDRLILEYMLGTTSVGIYSLAYNISMVLMLLNSGIGLVLPTLLIKNYDRWKEKEYDNRLIRYYSYITILLFAFILSLYKLDSIYFNILDYYSTQMIPLITIIYISIYVLGLYYFYANYLFYHRKAKIITKTTLYAATINIVLTIIFVYFFDIIGAAISTLLTYIFYLYRIRFEAKRVEEDLNLYISVNISFVFIIVLFISILTYNL